MRKLPLSVSACPLAILIWLSPANVSGAELTWLPDATWIVPGLDTSPTASVPLKPAATVYRLALSNTIVPTVRAPSSVTVRGAVIFPKNPASAVGPAGTMAGDQLLATPQPPLASTFHCGTC